MDVYHQDFRVICGSDKGNDRSISRGSSPSAFLGRPGDTISVKGNPYVIVDVSWATANNGINYCYVRLANLYVHKDAIYDIDRVKVIKANV